MAAVDAVVLEVGEMFGQQSQEGDGGLIGLLYQLDEGSVEVLEDSLRNFPQDAGAFIGEGYLHALEDILYHIFLGIVGELLEGDALLDSFLHVGGELFVFEVLNRPEAEVHGVEHEQLQKGDFGVLRGLVVVVLVEAFVFELLGELRESLVVDADVFGVGGDPLAGLSDQFALVGHSFILLMSISKTEEFIYFQNKARHYANLRQIRPAVQTHRERYSSMEVTSRVPYFQRYDRERQNEGLINRVAEIMDRPAEVNHHGHTRRNVSHLPPSQLAIEQRRAEEEIDRGNVLLADKVLKAKPSVGTITKWDNHFVQVQARKRNISKYTEERTSKPTLDLSSSTAFIPEHYRSFLGKSLPRGEPTVPIRMKIGVEQLLQLPKLKRMRGSFTRFDENNHTLD